MNDYKDIEKVIYQAFEIGKHKDLSILNNIYVNSRSFSRFGHLPPYKLQDFNEMCIQKEFFYSNITDYEFHIEDLKIEIFDNIAIALFILYEKGIMIDDYTFSGSYLNLKSRVTMILKKENDKWLILHEHLSIIT